MDLSLIICLWVEVRRLSLFSISTIHRTNNQCFHFWYVRSSYYHYFEVWRQPVQPMEFVLSKKPEVFIDHKKTTIPHTSSQQSNPPLDRDIMIAIFPDVILPYCLKILCNGLRFYMCLQHRWSQYSTLKKWPLSRSSEKSREYWNYHT